MLILTLVVIIFFVHLKDSSTHPQCLDFRPPFKPTSSLKFCHGFSSYSCCSNIKDNDLKYDFDYILSSTHNADPQCKKFLKAVLCSECHPYAAHVFDAEIPVVNVTYNKRRVHFPGLCRNYCLKLFDRCRLLLLLVVRDTQFYDFMYNTTDTAFCDWAQLSDESYCYPNNMDFGNKFLSKPNDDAVTMCVEPFSSSFANALVAVHSNDGTHRMFVGEQRGIIHIVDHTGKKVEPPFLDLRKRILNSGSPWDERGFLGLVFHPNYRKNGRFYVYYSAKHPDYKQTKSQKWRFNIPHLTRLSEFTVSSNNPNLADKNSELILLEINQPEPNHNGGMILFGTDGYLYIFPGDGGGSGDSHGMFGNSLNMSTLLGKALRIDIDVDDKLYSIPRDNPYINSDKPEIFAYGLRNPWRCSVDGDAKYKRGTGRIFCGDVGQNQFEEIDIIDKEGNYGWRAYEADSCYDINLCKKQNESTLMFPILAYPHSIGKSVVGGYVYRGCDNPNFRGKYFYADTMKGKIFLGTETNGNWTSSEIIMGNSTICNNGLVGNYQKNILSFGENEAGEIFILGSFPPHPELQTSRMYRLVDPSLRGDPETCQHKIQKPERLKNIVRRKIYQTIDKKIVSDEKEEKLKCLDLSKVICIRYFMSNKGKKPLLKCESAMRFVSKNCKQTCNLC